MSRLQFWNGSGKTTTKIDIGDSQKRNRSVTATEEESVTVPESQAKRDFITRPVRQQRLAPLQGPSVISGHTNSGTPNFLGARSWYLPSPFTCINRLALARLNGCTSSRSIVPGSCIIPEGSALTEFVYEITHGAGWLHPFARRVCSPNATLFTRNQALACNGIVGAPLILQAGMLITVVYRPTRECIKSTNPMNDGLILCIDPAGGSPLDPVNVINSNELNNFPSFVPSLSPDLVVGTSLIRCGETKVIAILDDWVFQPIYLCETSCAWTGLQLIVLPRCTNSDCICEQL